MASHHLHLDVHTYCIYTVPVKFEWDEAKRAANLAKHGIDFVDALEMFAASMFVKSDERRAYGDAAGKDYGSRSRLHQTRTNHDSNHLTTKGKQP